MCTMMRRERHEGSTDVSCPTFNTSHVNELFGEFKVDLLLINIYRYIYCI